MPELPEVEITRRGLLAELTGQRVTAVVIRNPRLRYPVPADLAQTLAGRNVAAIRRRGKYLVLDFRPGNLLLHLGMSGSLRMVDAATRPDKHDHLDIVFGSRALRLRDPRRFGMVLWESGEADTHSLLADLGIEPLTPELSGEWLYRATRGRAATIKQFLMDSHIIVGIGNIYASESLFRAGIRPRTPAGRLSRTRCQRLATAVRDTLEAALTAGGSSLRDYVACNGQPGHFQHQYFVYGRAGQPCRSCGTAVRAVRLGQRSTFYCPACQR